MIRFLIVASFVVLFLVLSIPALVIEWIIGKYNPERKDKSSLAIVNWGFRQVAKLSGTNLIVLGEENIPKDTAVLYVGNHRSFYDIILTYPRVLRPTGYIAKIETKKVPLLSNWMRNLHCLFLDRQNIKEGLKTILAAIEKVKSGLSICIFPEGTRNKVNDTFLPFHEGSFKIAEKSGCPIIPVTMVNMSDIFEDHLPRVKKTRVVIEFGTPIEMNALDREEKKHINTYVQNVIAETYKKNKATYF